MITAKKLKKKTLSTIIKEKETIEEKYKVFFLELEQKALYEARHGNSNLIVPLPVGWQEHIDEIDSYLKLLGFKIQYLHNEIMISW